MWWFGFYLMGGAVGGGGCDACMIRGTVGGHGITATITNDEHTLVVPSTITGYQSTC